MKRLFLVLFLLGFISPVSAESVWLIIHKGWGEHAALEKIEMTDMNQCELMGAKWKSSNVANIKHNDFGVQTLSHTCLKGK